MVKRIVVLLMVIVMGLVLISSCTLFGVAAAVMGGLLKLDNSGHFKEDIIYQWGDGTDRNVYSLNADGTVEYYRERYEDGTDDHDGDGVQGEGWVKVGGNSYKGTYSWNKDTFVLTEIATQALTNGEWTNLTNQTTWTNLMFFSENQFGSVFVKSETADNQWVFTGTTTTQNTGSSSNVQTLTVDDDASTFVMNTLSTSFDAAGTQTGGSEIESSGTFTVFPEGTKWRKGNSVTVMVNTTLTKMKFWDNTVANAWDATWAEDNDQSMVSYAFMHMGDYVVQPPTFTATRVLF